MSTVDQPDAKNAFATAGMVLGIVAAAISWIPILGIFALVIALVGLPLAGIGFARARRTGVGNSYSIAGIALNTVALLIWFAWAAVWGVALSEADAATTRPDAEIRQITDNEVRGGDRAL